MKVVEHKDKRRRARPERSGQARRRPSQHPGPRSLDFAHEIGPARVYLHVRRGQHSHEARGVVIETVEGHPGHATILHPRPFGQEGRLAVTGGRRDPDDPAVDRTSGLNELPAANAARAQLGRRQLELEQRLLEVATFRGCLQQLRAYGRATCASPRRPVPWLGRFSPAPLEVVSYDADRSHPSHGYNLTARSIVPVDSGQPGPEERGADGSARRGVTTKATRWWGRS